MLKISTSSPFARPNDTTAYASGDLVANHTTAGSVVPIDIGVHPVPGGLGKITRTKLVKSTAGVTNAAFRVHYYLNRPVVTNGDNGVWLSTQAGYLGFVDVTIDKAFSDGSAGVGTPAAPISFDLAKGLVRLFALIEARGIYTPVANETLQIVADIEYESAAA